MIHRPCRKNLPDWWKWHRLQGVGLDNKIYQFSLKLTRRRFIKTGITAAAGGVIFPLRTFANTCELTTNDAEGPFYASDAPFRSVIASEDEPGDRFFISGKVFSDDCSTPLENAVVDIWHANDNGCYSIFESCTTGNPSNDEYNLRGRVYTDQGGSYLFETIRPGFYGNRPQHFHYRIVAADGTELITQVYFEGDPNIAGDSLASDPDAQNRIIPVQENDNGFSGTFDISLDVESVIDIDEPWMPVPENFALYPAFPNPFNAITEIRFNIGVDCHASLEVFNLNGKHVKELMEVFIKAGEHQVVWNGKDGSGNPVPSGLYVIRFDTAHFSDYQKVLLVK